MKSFHRNAWPSMLAIRRCDHPHLHRAGRLRLHQVSRWAPASCKHAVCSFVSLAQRLSSLPRTLVHHFISGEKKLWRVIWEKDIRDNGLRPLSPLKRHSRTVNLPTSPGPTQLWGPGSIPDLSTDVWGFLKPPHSHRFRNIRKHGAVATPRKTLGLRDQDRSSHHETWLLIQLVKKWDVSTTHDDKFNQRIQLKDRSRPYHYVRQKKDIADV